MSAGWGGGGGELNQIRDLYLREYGDGCRGIWYCPSATVLKGILQGFSFPCSSSPTLALLASVDMHQLAVSIITAKAENS